MMGYTKKWTPPTIPLRNNLAAWKVLFLDVHDNLILAGFEQTDTPDQLDISGVSVLPADATFAGFREYILNDSFRYDAPITIRVEYGCGIEGISNNAASMRSRTPRIKVTVFFSGTMVDVFQCPQISDGSGTPSNATQLTTVGASFAINNLDLGFFGFVYGAGSRNKPFAGSFTNYYGATLCFFLQRSRNVAGVPDSHSVAVYRPNFITYHVVGGWTNYVLPKAMSTYSNGSFSVSRDDMAPRVGRDGLSMSMDQAMLEPIYYPSAPPKPFPYIVSHFHTDILEGEEFDVVDMYGHTRNFISIGRETSMSIDSVEGQNASIAMLFE